MKNWICFYPFCSLGDAGVTVICSPPSSENAEESASRRQSPSSSLRPGDKAKNSPSNQNGANSTTNNTSGNSVKNKKVERKQTKLSDVDSLVKSEAILRKVRETAKQNGVEKPPSASLDAGGIFVMLKIHVLLICLSFCMSTVCQSFLF